MKEKQLNKILIVDDERINRVLLRRIFSADYTIMEAEDGQQALQILKSTTDILAVVLDIQMPLLDGYEVLAIMKKDAILRDIPVIVVTGDRDEETQLKALSAGAMDVITKPFSPQIILHRVNNLIERLATTKALAFAKQAEQDLWLADTDELTGINNKKAFIRQASRILHENPNDDFILMRWDIDNFKVFNDTFGSAAGDEFLRTIGSFYQKKSSLLLHLVLTAHYDSDHFVCLIRSDNFDPDSTAKDLEKTINQSKKYPFDYVPRIGLYRITDHNIDVGLMCDRALLALKSIKHSYDMHYAWYDDSMRQDLIVEQNFVSTMDSALKNNEFLVYFQPQFNHVTHKLMGAKALVRWQKPGSGLISPGIFIPLFEKNGFIYELDKYVWEQTCIILQRWNQQGYPFLPVSVNVSRNDILHATFVETISSLIKKYNIPHEQLRLEITESAFAKDTGRLVETAKELRHLGFVIEIDDFGSGYSSFNTLKDVPADILKIDMRFLQGNNMQRGGSILESIVRMCRYLSMPTIAEGVETISQANFLASIGCTCIQGFLYSAPITVEKFESLMDPKNIDCTNSGITTTEGMRTDNFWNPNSLDSLIFSSYVGGACVLEYHAGKVRLIRVNRSFLATIKTDRSVEDIMSVELISYSSPSEAKKLISKFKKCNRIGQHDSGIYQYAPLHDKEKHVEYIRYNANVIAVSSDNVLYYTMVENITEQIIAEQNEQDISEQNIFLNNVSRNLLAEEDPDKSVQEVLKMIRTHFFGERSYILEFDMEKKTSYNTYESCKKGVTPYINMLQNIPFDSFPYWFKAFDTYGYLSLNVNELGEDRNEERELLEKQNISSLIAVPLKSNNQLIGALGIDNPKQNDRHVEQLIALGDFLAVLLVRRNLNKRISSDNRQLNEMITDIPGGFARMKFTPDGHIVPVFINDNFCHMLELTSEEAYALYQNDAYSCVCLEDVDSVRSIIEQAIQHKKKTFSLRIRVQGKRNIKWLQASYRVTTDENGIEYLNGYYIDVSLEKPMEQLRTELMENLPVGMAVYEFGDTIKPLYVNGITCSMFGFTQEEYNKRIKAGLPLNFIPQKYQGSKKISPHLQSGEVTNVGPVKVRRKDGSWFWLKLTMRLVKRIQGHPVAYAVLSDVTENQQQEELFQQNRQKLLTEYQTELQYHLAAQSDDLLAKLNIDLMENQIDSSWIRPDMNISCTTKSANQIGKQLSATAATVDQKQAIVELFNPKKLVAEFNCDQRSEQIEYQRRITSGRLCWTSISVKTYCDPENNHIKAFVYLFDIDDKKTPAMLVNRVITLESEMLGLIDVQSGFLYCYQYSEFEKEIAKTSNSNYRKDLDEYVSTYIEPASQKEALVAMNLDKIVTELEHGNNTYYFSSWVNDKNGLRRKKWFYTYLDDTHNTIVIMRTDITDVFNQQKKQEDAMSMLTNKLAVSQIDGMTGVYNRTSTEELIKKRLADPLEKSSALILIDLDDLKTINDTYGHIQGDRALKSMAQTFMKHFRGGDIVGRIGGDEFLMYLSGVEAETSLNKSLHSLLREISNIQVGNHNEYGIHCSIGCVISDPRKDTFSSLYKKADVALYHVKQHGKNDYVFYTPEMNEEGYVFTGHAAISLKNDSDLEYEEMQQLLETFAGYYPFVLSGNLSQNNYHMLESSSYIRNILPVSGNIDEYVNKVVHYIHKIEQKNFIQKLSRQALLRQYSHCRNNVECYYRFQTSDKTFKWYEFIVLYYENRKGDVCCFILARPANKERKSFQLRDMRKAIELSDNSRYEYICLIHPSEGTYEIFGSDGKAAIRIAPKGHYNTIVNELSHNCIASGSKREFLEKAKLDFVIEQLKANKGHYSFRYLIQDDYRLINYYYYEPTHQEIMLTVRKISSLDAED